MKTYFRMLIAMEWKVIEIMIMTIYLIYEVRRFEHISVVWNKILIRKKL